MNLVPAAILAACALLSSCGRPPKPVGASDFFKNPDTSAYRLSPNGERISFLKPWGKSRRLNIFVKSISGGEEKCVTSETNRDISDYFWKGNGRLVYSVDPNGDWNFRLRSVDLDGQVTPPLTPLGACAGLLNELEDSDEQILILLRPAGGWLFDVCRLNVVSGALEPVLENPGNVQRWITDQQGRIRAEIAVDGVDICLLTRRNDTEPFREVLATNFKESIKIQSYSFGENSINLLPDIGGKETAVLSVPTLTQRPVIYALSNIGRDKFVLVTINPDTGHEESEVCANPDFDIDGMEFSRKREVVTCVTFEACRRRRQCLDGVTDAIYKRIAKELKLPEDEIWITAHDKNEKKFIVEIRNDENPGESYLFEKPSQLSKLGSVAPQLKGRLARMECIEFTSRDGRTIHGYLTLPTASNRKNLPLVVIPHGGPWLRNVWGFDRENREVQFFASRGYAVLQINFRASSGYGREFFEAGFKQWGRAMQDDVTDGVLWAIDQGIADPKHIAIMGESYGGYAALAGITYTPDLYAAAVDRAGISNLLTLMEAYRGNAQLYEKIGDPEQDYDVLAAFSPELCVDKIKKALFVAHGANDPVVDPFQSDRIVTALRARGADVQYRQVANEGHIFANEENRIAYYEAVDKFLAKYLH